MTLRAVALDDKYLRCDGEVFLTGVQALVRLPLDRRRMDIAAGLDTGGFISGYRGSPLGGYDQLLKAVSPLLDTHRIRFWEGLNEDLAATAVWGSQQTSLFPGARCDGVFGIWYGKAPGVDRTGDAFKHANMAGVDPRGGVLAVAGDDPTCKSSTLPSQSEFAFMDAEIPILSPASVQEVLDFGLIGLEMSRFSGLWVGMIALADTMDSGAVVSVATDRRAARLPDDFTLPAGGLGIRLGDTPLDKERRLRLYKLPAAVAYGRANALNRTVFVGRRRRCGVIASGQAVREVMEALAAIGLSAGQAAELGLSLLQIGMPWPLDAEPVARFCAGLERVLVVEHKRPVIEPQVKSILFNRPAGDRPSVEGKCDAQGAPLLSDTGALGVDEIVAALLRLLPDGPHVERARRYFETVGACRDAAGGANDSAVRKPHFCSGCPHNTSTTLPEGSRALAGIGCHYMATFTPSRRTDMHTQMGGEGTPWIGQAPFTQEPHVFVNLGDGTYSHSGSLAVRAAVSAGVNVTYKILYNGAVAMTGGQKVESGQTVAQIARQMEAEGVASITIVADDLTRYASVSDLPEGVRIRHRSQLDDVQRALRETRGVSVLIYDQLCATEKRRAIKRGRLPAPPKRAFINTAVCEGCGDCSVKSNCLSIEPVETEFGRKRRINQSSCNTDLSCIEGFCPSFVTVSGGALQAGRAAPAPAVPTEDPPEPELPEIDDVFNIVFTGIGGAGVTTVAAVLAMAAFMDGKASQTLDMTGLAQKGGPVMSHVRIAARREQILAARTPPASADLLVACDLVVAASEDALTLVRPDRTDVVANRDVIPTKEFIENRNARFDPAILSARVRRRVRALEAICAEQLAERYLGDTIYANMIMLGAAWQQGRVPVSAAAIIAANRLNGVQAAANEQAFRLGRIAAADPDRVQALAPRRQEPEVMTLDALIERRVDLLTAYQNAAYAASYRSHVSYVRAAESNLGLGEGLSAACAKNLAKLMAYKDEYEVARLHASDEFVRSLEGTFSGPLRLTFHLAPPLLSRKTSRGEPIKRPFGGWMLVAFRLLARLKGLRGGAFDIFGRTHERRMERRLRDEYIDRVRLLARELTPANHGLAIEIASIPDDIRGFGHVKERSVEAAEQRLSGLMARWEAASRPAPQAAE
jgi:indolepyruvate ferredoxin oxidoreductase